MDHPLAGHNTEPCLARPCVLPPGRSVPLPRPLPHPPKQGPTLREINAAIRDDLAAQGPGRLEAAEAAARREGQAGGGAGGLGGALPDVQALEQALMSGEMGALRAYLDQLQVRTTWVLLPVGVERMQLSCCRAGRRACCHVLNSTHVT